MLQQLWSVIRIEEWKCKWSNALNRLKMRVFNGIWKFPSYLERNESWFLSDSSKFIIGFIEFWRDLKWISAALLLLLFPFSAVLLLLLLPLLLLLLPEQMRIEYSWAIHTPAFTQPLDRKMRLKKLLFVPFAWRARQPFTCCTCECVCFILFVLVIVLVCWHAILAIALNVRIMLFRVPLARSSFSPFGCVLHFDYFFWTFVAAFFFLFLFFLLSHSQWTCLFAVIMLFIRNVLDFF